jgi:hypothetical protein
MSYNKIATQNKVTPEHLQPLAYIYIRQSTFLQVREHTASAERQYDLAQRAYDLGWPRERVIIIDEDQGRSGTSSVDRTGFQRLVLEVSLGRVGNLIKPSRKIDWWCARSNAPGRRSFGSLNASSASMKRGHARSC